MHTDLNCVFELGFFLTQLRVSGMNSIDPKYISEKIAYYWPHDCGQLHY